MTDVFVAGIDPGLAHFGIVVAAVGRPGLSIPNEDGKPAFFCIETEKSAKKLTVKASDDNTRRAREIFDPVARVLEKYKVKALCVESMSFPRSASAAHKMGISWGILVALSSVFGLPMVQASPQQIKKTVCGRQNASKEDIQNALSARYKIPVTIMTKERREHPFDALGAIEACLDSEVIRMVRSMGVERGVNCG